MGTMTPEIQSKIRKLTEIPYIRKLTFCVNDACVKNLSVRRM